jgi:hypothetical protein
VIGSAHRSVSYDEPKRQAAPQEAPGASAFVTARRRCRGLASQVEAAGHPGGFQTMLRVAPIELSW